MSCKVSTPVTYFELFLNLLFTSPSLPFQVKVFVLRGAQITESEAQGNYEFRRRDDVQGQRYEYVQLRVKQRLLSQPSEQFFLQ